MDTQDFYCDFVLNKKIAVKIVKETDNVLAYYHTKPFWQEHIVVIPKKHIPSLLTLDLNDKIFIELFDVIQEVSKDMVGKFGSCRVLTNLGKYQDSKHLHWHVAFGDEK